MSESRLVTENSADSSQSADIDASLARILIVDDSPETRFTYQRYLDRSDTQYAVTEADTAAAGLAALDADKFDCILLDFRMPDASGLAFLGELRDRPINHNTPVIMTTGEGNETVAVEAMKLGAKDYLIKGAIDKSALTDAITRVISETRKEQEELCKIAELQRLSTCDELTGLSNRRHLLGSLKTELRRWRRYRTPTSVIMIDLDYFKQVNDIHGHLIGDQVLKKFSAMLLDTARTVDVVARVGGEEFCLVLCNTDGDGAMAFADRICQAARDLQHIDRNGDSFQVTCSIGLVQVNEIAATCERVLDMSDMALYEAKDQGRDRYCVYDTRPQSASPHPSASGTL